MLMRLPLSSFDQVPDKFYEFVHVEFKMPATTVSHAVIRSISVSGCDAPPEKYANYVSLYEYVVDLPIIHANDDNPYNLAVGAVRKPTASGQHDTPSFGEAEAAKDSDDSEDYYPNYDEEDEEEEEEALKQETPAAGVRIVGSATASPARPPPPTRTT